MSRRSCAGCGRRCRRRSKRCSQGCSSRAPPKGCRTRGGILGALDALDDLNLAAAHAPGAAALRAQLVDTEQHLVSVLLVTPPSGAGEAPISMGAATMNDPCGELLSALADHGARAFVLADGSLVATLVHASGAATDQAAAAARCALLIKARWPGATIALCTGRGLLHERSPVGEVLDRAAALLRDHPSSTPISDHILLDEVTRRLLEVRLRVHRTPSGAYALSGEELDLDASRPLLGKPTPCVGRDVELAMLESALSGCIQDGEPHSLLVTAPPGAGKSRLRHELLRRVEAREDGILVIIGRGDPMSGGSSYGLLGQALRRLCGIQDRESLEVRRAKLGTEPGGRSLGGRGGDFGGGAALAGMVPGGVAADGDGVAGGGGGVGGRADRGAGVGLGRELGVGSVCQEAASGRSAARPSRHRSRVKAAKLNPANPATPFQLIQIAAAAGCDPRTVQRRLKGVPGASTIDARIDRALSDLGLEHLRADAPSEASDRRNFLERGGLAVER